MDNSIKIYEFDPCVYPRLLWVVKGGTLAEISKVLELSGYEEDESAGAVTLCNVRRKTDEDNLGFTYAELDRYIRTGEIEDLEKKALIDRKHKANYECNKIALEIDFFVCFRYVFHTLLPVIKKLSRLRRPTVFKSYAIVGGQAAITFRPPSGLAAAHPSCEGPTACNRRAIPYEEM